MVSPFYISELSNDIMALPRSVLLFEESFRSEQTKHLYLYYLRKFLLWAKKDAESFLLLSSAELVIQ